MPSLLRVRELAPRCLPRAPVPRVDSTAPIRWAQAQLPDLDTLPREEWNRHAPRMPIATLSTPRSPFGFPRNPAAFRGFLTRVRVLLFALGRSLFVRCRITSMLLEFSHRLMSSTERFFEASVTRCCSRETFSRFIALTWLLESCDFRCKPRSARDCFDRFDTPSPGARPAERRSVKAESEGRGISQSTSPMSKPRTCAPR